MNNTNSNAQIDYTTLLHMIQKEKTVVVAHVEGVVHDLVRKAQEDAFSQLDENGEASYEASIQHKMTTLANFFQDDSLTFQGSSHVFHNLAVDYSRQEMNKGACLILERGIKLRSASVDLLADFLLYGREIPERREDCKRYFETLSNLPRSMWNWRAFSFSISHLLEERFYISSNEEEKNLKRKSLKLAKEFVSRFSKERADQEYIDRAYSDMASIYQAFADPENEYKTLEICTEKYSRVPITALRLAEIMFSSGDYQAATERLNKCVQALNPQPSVNQGYIYLLRAYCKASTYLESQMNNNTEENEKTNPEYLLSEIYKDLDTAESLIENPTYEKAINTLRSILEKQAARTGSSRLNRDEDQW